MDWKNTAKNIGLTVGQSICNGIDAGNKKLARERDDYVYDPSAKNLADMIEDYRNRTEED